MGPWALAAAAALLSVERIAYAVVWRHPGRFRRWAARPSRAWLGGPVEVLAALFVLFKAVQAGVFAGWIYLAGDGTLRPYSSDPLVWAGGGVLVAVGQALSTAVFRRLGRTGVFYGGRLGYDVPWCTGFPFSWFDHPQYIGTVLSIWGLFLLMRFPAPDWLQLPVLETVYYAVGVRLERDTGLGYVARRDSDALTRR